jgi:hypothetical protein
MAKVGALAAELSQWEMVHINIRDPEPHEVLMKTFNVRAIAHWQALGANDCKESVTHWPRLGARSVEPTRGGTGAALPELVAWLEQARGKASDKAE